MVTITATIVNQGGYDKDLIVQIGEHKSIYSDIYYESSDASAAARLLLTLYQANIIDLKCTDEATSKFIF